MANLQGLRPEVRQSLGAAASALAQAGIPYTITSGFRTRAEQQALYDHPQGYPVARAGTSPHEFGYAVDLTFGGTPDQQDRGRQILWENGFGQPVPDDPVHYEYMALRPKGSSRPWWDTTTGASPPVLPPFGGVGAAPPPATQSNPRISVPPTPSTVSDGLLGLIRTTVFGQNASSGVPQVGIPQVPVTPGTAETPPAGGGVQDLINSVRFGPPNS